MHRSFHHLSKEERKKYCRMRQYILRHIKNLAGEKSLQGFEIGNMIRKIGNMYDTILNVEYGDSEISNRRLEILAQLYIINEIDKNEKITPTSLSHFQSVNKNTISSLINGLESQGLLVREMDTNDRRMVRLKITDAGRDAVKALIPPQIDYMNVISSELTDAEKEQLIDLLTKLMVSMKNSIRQHGAFRRRQHSFRE
jgi:DNA-binding MarR family transcriptional regulator